MEYQEPSRPGAGDPPEAGALSPVPRGIGPVLRQTRIAQGLSLFVLAHELNLGVPILEAVEAEAWDRLPPGRERPHVRQIADRLGVDLATFTEQWSQLPGVPGQESRDPRRESLERILVSAIMMGSLGVLAWLVVPGPSLKRAPRAEAAREVGNTPAAWVPKPLSGPYPVVGEVLPEVPVNGEGALIVLRAMDTCQATIQGPAQDPHAVVPAQTHTLRVSEPWQLRVKGPFTIALDNAGVVALEVAGRRIRVGRTVGEPWMGRFGPAGEYLAPEDTSPRNPPSPPESDPNPPEAGPDASKGE